MDSNVGYAYYLLNKPKGVITTTSNEFGRPIVMDLVEVLEKVFPVDRFDENTSGLILSSVKPRA